jgi:hypothetical protein
MSGVAVEVSVAYCSPISNISKCSIMASIGINDVQS